MANTTNFGWSTPNDTDYVTDGAAAMRELGQDIDTTMVDLKGGTTGQILSKATNTDMDFTWVSPTAGDIEGVTATSPLTGGGTSGTVTVGIQSASTTQLGAVQLSDSTSSTSTTLAATANSVKSAYDLANAAIPKSLIDAAGDLIVGTADNTAGRVAIGSNGTVLTSNGTTATWATPAAPSSMVSLASGSYTGTALNITGLSTSYNTLIMQLSAFDPSGGTVRLRARFNADTGNKYLNFTSTNTSAANFNIGYLEVLTPDAHSTDARAAIYIQMNNYATSNAYKQGLAQAIVTNPASTLDVNANLSSVYYNSTTAISQVNFFDSAGGTFSLTYQIWGVK